MMSTLLQTGSPTHAVVAAFGVFGYQIRIYLTHFRFTWQIEWPVSSEHVTLQVKMDSSRFHRIWIWN